MDNQPNYKWYILFLTALTGAFGLAAPFMSLSVLFKEISADLHLNLVQVGFVWSIGSLPAIFISMLSGAINDRFGPKRVILAAVLLLGAAGASRGLATNFPSLLIAVIFFGLLSPMISTSAFKICGLWFPGRQLGLANGVFAAGMALGFFISSLVSANVLSVWLGGWRHVMFFYGGLTALLCIPWYFARSTPKVVASNVPSLVSIPMRQAISHVVKLKDIWLLSITLMGMSGCMQGITGYIPTYLRGLGWSGLQADGALSLFHAVSMIFVLPIALWSDRLKARKPLLTGMMVIIVVSGIFLATTQGTSVWVVIAMMGMVRDASMAVIMTMFIESKGVGPAYAGSATGFGLLFLSLGSLVAPPLGNRLGEILPSLPFAFWAGMAAVGLVSLLFVKGSRRGVTLLEQG